ncbi:MAG: Ig-like domain-containing protein, partial [Clostridia bacterium]|nr:Ig-like domain-containing protein [Clostridia bacterium]
MRKKWLKTMVSMITVFVLGLSFGLLAACNVTIPSSSESSAIDGGSNDGKSIVLDITSVKTFIGESVQLRAICKNVDESLLVWESSDDSVASVTQSGLVTALKKGAVKITVSAEGLSAVCSVNISESDAAPVLALSINEVDLRIGDSFSVVASTYYNGKLETVDYTWEFEDEKTSSEYISYTLNEDGSKVTFTALKEGSERLCVFANCKGIDLVEYLTVNAVDNDVYFTVDNFDGGKGGYFTELSLAKVENHLDSIIPEVEVFVAGEKQSNAQITWSNSNPAVAVMDEFGSISGLTVGVAVFTAKVEVNGKSAPLNLTVSVYAPELNYELSSAVEVDFNDTNSTFEVNLSELEQKLEGELVEVTIEGKPFGIKAHNGAILSLDKESVGGIYTEQEAVATFLRKRGEVTIAVEKVRMAVRGYRSISTVEQFNSMESYMQMEGTDAYADLRLVSDLDLQGAAMAGVGTYINTGSGWIANYYWKGVFDGQGHTIYNALESGTNSGLFCSISSGGIVRNVRFVNATLTGNSGIIATANDGGLVENVFVHGKISGLVGSAGIPPSLIVSKNYTGTIREC